MKILHFLSGFPVSYNGGITNYIRSLTAYQREAGNQVSVLCGKDADPEIRGKFDEVIEFDGLSVVSSLSFMRDSGSKTDFLLRTMAKFDVVHFHSLYGLPIGFFSKKIPVKYVVTLHDYNLICPRIFMVDKWGGTCFYRDVAKCARCVGVLEQVDILYRAARKFSVKLPTMRSDNVLFREKILDDFLLNAAVCHAVSSRVKTIFDSAVYGLSCEKENLALDDLYFDNSNKKPRLKKCGPINIIYMGTLNHVKGADVMLRLLDGLSDKKKFNVEVWGRCDPMYVAPLRDRGVVFRGKYSQKQVGEILEGADIGMVLSVWNETGPLVMQEMLLNKVPVLGSNMGGVPDFVNDAVGKIFDPHSSEGIMEAADWLNCINHEKINALKNSIPPMKRMRDHLLFVEKMYHA